ncbi:MAG: hypothetical protein LBB62_07550 [Proteiniphilum sp.]|jgi:hypothetical protein|nr:hypothetical protein [Proteiniphilum sp.]
MPGFNRFTRVIRFWKKAFYGPFRWFLRKKQSKGHGIHSPFAFDLITNVIHSPHSFYAFSDIRETMPQNGIDPNSITVFNRLSFRLTHYLQSENILEINSGNGINTLFLTSPSPHIRCTCIEENGEKVAVAERLQRQTGRKWKMAASFSDCKGEHYDAIFTNLKEGYMPDINTLAELSNPGAFWVFHPIKKGTGKQFWNKIVHDEKARITFDAKDTGIVFLRPDYHKANYLV